MESSIIMNNLRSYERSHSVESLEYTVTVSDHKNRTKKIDDVAVMIDLSSKGMGVLINHPVQAGSVMNFKNGKKTQGPVSEKAIVKWSYRIDDTTYRAGLKFI
jgi:hypothetical protein